MHGCTENIVRSRWSETLKERRTKKKSIDRIKSLNNDRSIFFISFFTQTASLCHSNFTNWSEYFPTTMLPFSFATILSKKNGIWYYTHTPHSVTHWFGKNESAKKFSKNFCDPFRILQNRKGSLISASIFLCLIVFGRVEAYYNSWMGLSKKRTERWTDIEWKYLIKCSKAWPLAANSKCIRQTITWKRSRDFLWKMKVKIIVYTVI